MDNRVHIRVSRRFLVVAIAFPSSLRAPCPHSKNLNKLKGLGSNLVFSARETLQCKDEVEVEAQCRIVWAKM
jgi:hypothetical protein